MKHPPDAHHGFYMSSSVVSGMIPYNEQLVETIPSLKNSLLVSRYVLSLFDKLVSKDKIEIFFVILSFFKSFNDFYFHELYAVVVHCTVCA